MRKMITFLLLEIIYIIHVSRQKEDVNELGITNWNNGLLYNNFMGKWSTLVAQKFLLWLGNEKNISFKNWLDVGCGTGALSFEILNSLKPERILGIDPSKEYLPKGIHNTSISFKEADSSKIPAITEIFDFVVSGLALNFMKDLNTSIQEMKRVLKLIGCLALYVWDYSEKMEFLRYFWDSVKEINPEYANLDEGVLFPICKKPALVNLFTSNQLKDIECTEIMIETNFTNFDDYWNPFLGGQGPAGKLVQTLAESERDQLKSIIKSKLQVSTDEPILLQARAYAIKGKK